MRGNPLERAPLDRLITTASSARPSRCTRRNFTKAVSPVPRSSQLTYAAPSSSWRPTRPAGSPSSTRTGSPKLAPASYENATCTFAVSRAAVNQATTTVSPSACTIGPFTGQKSTSQLSACTGCAAVHAPSTKREITTSRISGLESLRSRYTTTGPREVIAALVWQQSQTRLSSTCFASTRIGVDDAPHTLLASDIGMAWLSPSCECPPCAALLPPSRKNTVALLSPTIIETKPCSAATPRR